MQFPDFDLEYATIDKITTQGRFNADTIARERVLLPDPLLPAIPTICTPAHGGV
jgi:hypothetical protein